MSEGHNIWWSEVNGFQAISLFFAHNIQNTVNWVMVMNKTELMDRLNIMRSTDVVTETAVVITIKTFDHLVLTVGQSDILQGEMLFTHLCMALTRLERGEEIEAPPEALLPEIKRAGFTEITNREIDYIEKQLREALPEAEKNYLHLHYATVFQQNVGGDKSGS